MKSNLLKAAERGDVAEAKRALLQDPYCINDLESGSEMNALQLALVNFHYEMASFLLENTEISVRHKDSLGRDSLHLGLLFANNNEDLLRALNERWTVERFREMQAEKVPVAPTIPSYMY